MDAALVASALMMGLAGAPHCAAMCGGAYAAIAGSSGSTAPQRALLALQLGRAVSYAAAGALVAGSVSGLAGLATAAPLVRPLWTLLHLAAIALGLALIWNGHAPRWLAGAGQRLQSAVQPLRFVRRVPASVRAGTAGLCWGLLPCGLLQSALIVAALASGPLQGAGVMTAFAATSAVGLWAGPALWARLRFGGRGNVATTWPVRLAGALLVAASTLALVHGLRETIEAALCLP